MSEPIQRSSVRKGDALTLSVAGEWDLSTAGETERWLARETERAASVVLDLSDLVFADSAALHTLFSLSVALREGKVPLTIVAPRGRSVAQALRTVRLDQVVTLVDPPPERRAPG